MASLLGRHDLLAVSFVSFIMIGLPSGALGTAWPSMRQSFGRSVSSLVWVLLILRLGRLLWSLGSGWLSTRIGWGKAAVAAAAVSTVGLLIYAGSPHWWTLLVGALLVGAGDAGIDAALNVNVALNHGPRAMGLMHGFFGVGATLGPLLVISALALDASWRFVYLVMAVARGALMISLWSRHSEFDRMPAAVKPVAKAPEHRSRLGLTLSFFFLVTGIEVALGQWAFSFFTEARGMGHTAAGLVVAAFFIALTGGRFLLGGVGHRWGPVVLLRWAAPGVLVTTTLMWANPAPSLGLIGFVASGLALSSMFPSLMTLTPHWMGVEQTGLAIGYQMAAGSVGAVAIPGVVGLFADAHGLEVLGPWVTGAAVALVAVEYWSRRPIGALRPAS